MRRTARTIGILSVALACAACGDDDGSGGGECADAPSFAQVSAFQVCVNCHSSSRQDAARNGAPSSINFDTYEAASENALRAAHEVEEGDMPPPLSGFSVTSEQRATLEKWANCGAPR
jgi:uncharacterized membrane protein